VREVGEVVSRFQQFIICRSKKRTKFLLGEAVYSTEGELVGTIVDIFGPVKRPYLKVLKKNGDNVNYICLKH